MLKTLFPLFALALTTSARADEWIVDLAGRGDVTSIQAAVDLALDGDVIVVRPGTYVEDVTVQGKGVWVVAQQSGELVRIDGGLHLDGIPLGTQVVLRDLTVAPDDPAVVALRIDGAEGLIQLVGCHFQASGESFDGPTLRSAARLDGARRVNAIDTVFEAGVQADANLISGTVDGDPGILAIDSRLAAWGGRIAGADGARSTIFGPYVPGDGGTGLLAMGSEVFLSGATVRGGDGGYDGDWLGLGGGAAGSGLDVDAGSRVFVIDSSVEGGDGGASSVGLPGPAGPVRVGVGPAYFLRGEAQVHGAGAFALNQSNLELTLQGRQGYGVDLYLTTDVPPFLFDRGASWTLVTGSAPVSSYGPFGPAGSLVDTVAIPQIPSNPATLTATFIAHVNLHGRGAVLGAPIPVVGVNCQAFGSDCDASGRSDLCEIVEGSRPDVDGNGQVDSCDVDCNGNGVPDTIDIGGGTSADVNGNGVPDECEPVAATWYVGPAAAPGGNGSPGAPFASIAEALAQALDGHQIVLLDGVHRSAGNVWLDLGSRAVTVRSQGGPGACTVDLEGASRCIFASGSPTTGQLVIDGIRFLYGAASGFPGAVIQTFDRSIAVQNCVFESDAPGASGGAMLLRGGVSRVTGCTFQGPGGGVFDEEAAMIIRFGGVHLIEECLFKDHRSEESGAALDVQAPGASVVRCAFLGARSQGHGGAVRVGSGGPAFDHCLFAGNVADLGGGALWLISSSSTVSSCTFVDNEAPLGAAIEIEAFSAAAVTNSILRGTGEQLAITSISINGDEVGSSVTLDHVNLLGPVGTTGQPVVTVIAGLDIDPLFTLPAGPDGDPATLDDNDYSLGAGSPCVDAGANALIAADLADADGDQDRTEPTPLDLAGAPRRRDDPAVADTGTGAAPLVDLGCFERQP